MPMGPFANCTRIDPKDIIDSSYVQQVLSDKSGGGTTWVQDFTARAPVKGCSLGDQGLWPSSGDLIVYPSKAPNDGYFGTWEPACVEGAMNYSTVHPGCSTIIAAFGLVSGNVTKEFTAFICTPYVESLGVGAAFILPGYSIDLQNPPYKVSSGTVFSNDSIALSILGGALPSPVTSAQTLGRSMDTFFDMIINGKDGIPASELSGEANVAVLSDAIELLFGRVAAQYLNLDREPAPPGNSSLDAQLVSVNRVRVVQSTVSTRILQVLLALMFVCAAVTFSIMDTRNVLPKNPCSIAAVASMLAGSEMLHSSVIPEGSEWRDSDELASVYERWVFSLGWWGEKGSKESRFGVDVGAAEKTS
ncbi:hypothetical protein B0A49_07756 [Cryomyces minteri]|uniref:Uncharacterized protein n=1 Tax=Cryomyces minteri TaxID=331657 RepID=A0A4U0XA88_9PEZI|nr:hypothetical protein B0A49_07756 [Cryomyces minteri]